MAVSGARGAVVHCIPNVKNTKKVKIAKKKIARSCCPLVSDSRLMMMLLSRKPPAPPNTVTTPVTTQTTSSGVFTIGLTALPRRTDWI